MLFSNNIFFINQPSEILFVCLDHYLHLKHELFIIIIVFKTLSVILSKMSRHLGYTCRDLYTLFPQYLIRCSTYMLVSNGLNKCEEKILLCWTNLWFANYYPNMYLIDEDARMILYKPF